MTMEVICTVYSPAMGWGGETMSLTLWSDNITSWLTGQQAEGTCAYSVKKEARARSQQDHGLLSC